MVKKEIPSLHEQCIQLVSENIWKFTEKHFSWCHFCSLCQTEKCSAIKNAKDTLMLPHSVIRNLYKKLYDVFTEHCHTDKSTAKAELFYLLLSVLNVENSSLKIEYHFTENIPFVQKFGNNVGTLHLRDLGEILRTKCGKITLPLFRTVLQNTNYIHDLDIGYVKLSNSYFKVIGRECSLLKTLSGLWLHKNPNKQFSECTVVTQKSFKELLLQGTGYGNRSKCCGTLESVELIIYDDRTKKKNKILKKILSMLFANVPNLKTVGHTLTFDVYLQSLKPREVRKTNIENIQISKLTKELLPLLKTFCPRVKTLEIGSLNSRFLQQLKLSFRFMERLIIEYVENTEYMLSEIVTPDWCMITDLQINSKTVDIDALATQCPLLTNLDISWSNNIIWKRTAYFNGLKSTQLSLSNSDIFWFASFQRTIKTISIDSNPNIFTPLTCRILLTTPFPNLEDLSIDPFPHAFLFYKMILKNLPKLRSCVLVDESDSEADVMKNVADVKDYLKQNNLECWLSDQY